MLGVSYDVDQLARHLSRVGRVGALMPRGAFEVQGDAYPFYAGSHRVGHVLPGVGLVLDADAKRLGFAKRPPYVYDRTPLARTLERIARNEAGAITSRAALASAYASTKMQSVYSDSTAYLNGDVCTCWFFTFDAKTAGNFSSPGTTCNRTSPANAFNANMMDPPSGQTMYLCGLSAMLAGTSTTNNGFSMAMIVDILAQSGNVSWTSGTGPFTYSTPALTRYTSGVGVYSTLVPQNGNQLIMPACTLTMTYTNQAGTSGRTTTFVMTTSEGQTAGECPNDTNATVGVLPFFTLASGDYGVQSVSSFSSSAAATSGQNVGVLLYHPHVFYQPLIDVGMTVERDAATEPEKLLCVLPTESGGTLGYLGAAYCVSGTNAGFGPAAQVVTWTLDTCWG